MKRNIIKLSRLMIIITLCFSMIGCDGTSPVKAQDRVLLESQNEIPKNEIMISDAPEEIDEIESANIDDQSTSELEEDTEVEEDTDEANEVNGIEVKGNEVNGIVFKETSETTYATANVNLRSAYTTGKNNVVSLLKKGKPIKRIGIHDEWSKVLYQGEICYVKTDYLTLQKPKIEKAVVPKKNDIENTDKETSDITQNETAKEPSSGGNFISDLNIASVINRLVCVVGNGGSSCTVSFHIKDAEDKWQQQFSVDGDCGSDGITYDKQEGDKKTPAGLFSFTLAFGIKSNPGAILTYHKVTKYDYWVDDVTSPFYNTLVNSQEKPGDYNSEHLIDHSPSYNYALNINYNPDCTPGLGSAVFLHCYNGLGSTTGCIAIPEATMKTLLKEVDSSTMILIVPSSADLANY